MTKQEIFDKVITHLRKQNKKATNIFGGCEYKNVNGLRCAVGCLIPDDMYDKKMELSSTVDGLFRDFLEIQKLLGKRNKDFLTRIQVIYDSCRIENWEERWENLAKVYNLEYTPTSS